MVGQDRKSFIEIGWSDDLTTRYIVVGRLRLEEKVREGATTIFLGTQEDPSERRWNDLTSTELVGLVQHLGRWFGADPVAEMRSIEKLAAGVKHALEAFDARARMDEEHPPYEALVQKLDAIVSKCSRFCEVGIFAQAPIDRVAKAPNLAGLSDSRAEEHPAYDVFCRQMRGRVYDAQKLNDAWEAFKQGWDRWQYPIDNEGGPR